MPGLDFLQIAQDRGPNAVLGEQRIFPAWVHEPFLTPQTEAHTIAMVNLVPHMLYQHKEVTQVVGVLDSCPQVILQHGAEGGLAPGLAQPFDIADRLGGLALHDDGQPMLPAQPVRDTPDLAVILLCRDMIFFPGLGVHRVEHQMGMDVAFIHMGPDDHLVISQVLGGKFFCDLQRKLWGDFPRLEGLDDMIALTAIQLSHIPLGIHHLPEFPAWVAVLMGGEDLMIRFIPVQHILDCLIQTGVPSQYFSNRHYFLAI